MLDKLLRPVDAFIDGVTMYRLLIYYLIGLLLVAMGLSAFKDLGYNPVSIAFSASFFVLICWSVNRLFAAFFAAPINSESSIITGLILSLIISPNLGGLNLLFLIAAAGLAIASKYLLTIRRKHIFNPAAVAVVLTALGPRQSASWWIGTAAMLPFVILGGLLITRKLRRERMVLTFLVSVALFTVVYALLAHADIRLSLHNMVFSSGVFFLAFVMLTEPYTSPTTEQHQVWYAAFVAALWPPQVHILSFYFSPELALVCGNVFAYIVSPKTKLFPKLKQKELVAANTYDFVFDPMRKLHYQPGQYLECTLPHKNQDDRGSRRYFTLASSPTESTLRIGVKFYNNGSTFKRTLQTMTADTPIVMSQVAGDFILPPNRSQKLVFIAGGIGITPFRSMVQYLIDTADTRDIVLLYAARTAEDFAYKMLFARAHDQIGLRSVYAVSDPGAAAAYPGLVQGTLSDTVIWNEVPDYIERVFYISGTHQMVVAIKSTLRSMGVAEHNIKIDFFPGYA